MGGAPGTLCALSAWGSLWCTLSAHGYPPTTPRRDSRTFFSTFRGLWRSAGKTSDVLRAGGPFMGISGAQNGNFLNFFICARNFTPIFNIFPKIFYLQHFQSCLLLLEPMDWNSGRSKWLFPEFFYLRRKFLLQFQHLMRFFWRGCTFSHTDPRSDGGS